MTNMAGEGRGATTAQGIGLRFLEVSASDPSNRQVTTSHHVLVVHRRGPREVGEVQVIPAGQPMTALTGGFCEITVPRRILGDRKVRPRQGYRDPLLYAITERLAGLSTRDDDTAKLIRDGLGDVIRLHVRDCYTAAAQQLARKNTPSELGPLQCRTVVNYVDANLGGPVRLDRIAAQLGVGHRRRPCRWISSPSHFATTFRHHVGLTPSEYRALY